MSGNVTSIVGNRAGFIAYMYLTAVAICCGLSFFRTWWEQGDSEVHPRGKDLPKGQRSTQGAKIHPRVQESR